MARRRGTRAASGPATDQTISKAMPRKEFVALLTRLIASKKVVTGEQKSQRDLKGDAADLHRGALGWIVRLKGMTPAKRNEQLFHFHAYCDYLGWPEKGLDLGDREPATREQEPAHEGGDGEREQELAQDGEAVNAALTDVAVAYLQDEGKAHTWATYPSFPGQVEDERDVRPRFLRTGGSDAPLPDTKPDELPKAH